MACLSTHIVPVERSLLLLFYVIVSHFSGCHFLFFFFSSFTVGSVETSTARIFFSIRPCSARRNHQRTPGGSRSGLGTPWAALTCTASVGGGGAGGEASALLPCWWSLFARVAARRSERRGTHGRVSIGLSACLLSEGKLQLFPPP